MGLLLEEDADLSDTRLVAPPSTTAEDPLGETASPGEALFFTWLSSLFGDVGFTSGSSTSLPLLLSSSGRLTSGPVLFNAESLLFFGGVGRLRFALTFAAEEEDSFRIAVTGFGGGAAGPGGDGDL